MDHEEIIIHLPVSQTI